ncbi:MAG: DUF6371 domain-containing protein [Xanthobacteraceae bacterium]
MSDPFAPLGITTPPGGPEKAARSILTPVPSDAPPVPKHRLGAPHDEWRYLDAAGKLLGYVFRFDTKQDKQFRPCTLWRDNATGEKSWRWESWSSPRPLYGLDRLAARPNAPVVIVEGEKACDAATRLLPAFVAVTSPNGSKSAGKADWTPLAGRRVVIWPDADEAGFAFAAAVNKALAGIASEVLIVSPPADCAVGWDAADAEAEGWNVVSTAVFVDGARSTATAARTAKEENNSRKRESRSDTLMQKLESLDLWHDADFVSYATVPIGNHVENWSLRSPAFKRWLANFSRKETGQVVSGQTIDDVTRNLEAIAINERPRYQAFRRVGGDAGRLYIDLCDDDWRAVEVTKDGWRVLSRPPVKFIRSSQMRALPVPEAGEGIELLNSFLNVRGNDDRLMVVAFLVSSLRDRGPYPILVVNGEQGTGKSIFTRMVRSLVDPNLAPIRAMPKDERDLMVSVQNARMLAFDNLSSMPNWLSDAMCRVSTGGGFATRMLHTDNEENICNVQCPIILNGIPALTDRADLADRALNIHLAVIPEDRRKPEDEFVAAFDIQIPFILGALLDAVSTALRKLPDVKLDRLPRMADFVKWLAAAESGLGWESGEFMAAYERNRLEVSEGAFRGNPVAVAIYDFIMSTHRAEWRGTPTDLLNVLSNRVSDEVRKSRYVWPQTAQAMGNAFDRVAPLLRSKGFTIDRDRSGARVLIIVPPSAVDSEIVPL